MEPETCACVSVWVEHIIICIGIKSRMLYAYLRLGLACVCVCTCRHVSFFFLGGVLFFVGRGVALHADFAGIIFGRVRVRRSSRVQSRAESPSQSGPAGQ